MTVRQVREAKQIMGNLLHFHDQLQAINQMPKEDQQKEMEKLSKLLMNKSEEQDVFLQKTLTDCIVSTPEQIDNMDYLDALELFNKLYLKSTQVEKKQELQSESSSSQAQ